MNPEAGPRPFETRLSQPTERDRTSASNAVANELREAILQGRLKPGERILQQELAEHFGVSRQPVRDALSALKSEGLITELMGRGTVVRVFTDADIRENYYLRRVLESEAAKLTCSRITVEEIDMLRHVNYRMKVAVSEKRQPDVLRENYEFHRLMRDWAGLPTLAKFISELWSGITIATPASVPGRALRSVHEHEDIIQAFTVRDPQLVHERVSKHIRTAEADYSTTLRHRGKAEDEGTTIPRLSCSGPTSTHKVQQ